MNALPGMAIYNDLLDYYVKPIRYTKTTNIIFLSCPKFDSTTLFNNGIVQNILILYKLIELLGYTVYLFVPSKGDSFIDKYSYILPEDFIKNPFSVYLYIEVGMSVELSFIEYLKKNGTKIVKLYLGNALNIDIENINIAKYIQFPHHTSNHLDELWTSPHYLQNLDYLCTLYSLESSKGKIAPYLWDPMFIEMRKHTFYKKTNWTEIDIVIVEPNISFQKCAYLPLLLANMFAKQFSNWKGKIYVYNTQHLKGNVENQKKILDRLLIFQTGRVILGGRVGVHDILDKHSDGVFISHQVNNEFNYFLLELLWSGFPILHTSYAWKDFGYYWSEYEWTNTIDKIKKVMENHTGEGNDAKILAWNHSIYNPIIQAKWKELLESK